MRSLVLKLSCLCVLLLPAFAQQPDSSQNSPTAPPKTNASSKKAQASAAKSPDAATTAQEEPKPESPKDAAPKDKDQHFDMTEVAPMVTHHQITVNGKVLHYTATAGRLPIKRADGKTEAQMFFVAYTLEDQTGQQAAADLCL